MVSQIRFDLLTIWGGEAGIYAAGLWKHELLDCVECGTLIRNTQSFDGHQVSLNEEEVSTSKKENA